jgi:predicted homoserine dehydrogenase-like protein
MRTGTTGAGKLSRKLLAILAMSGMSLPGIANEVYIEQVGSGSTVTITQDGSDNRVGSSLTPSYIGSGSNTVTIDQIGANNELDLVVNGAGTDVIVDITGSTTISTINCGTTASAGCSGSFIKQAVTGDSNTITQNLGGGANHTSEITIAGSDNIVSHTSTATGTTSADITVTGDTNTISVVQSGMLNKNVVVNSTGNLNNISITQSD